MPARAAPAWMRLARRKPAAVMFFGALAFALAAGISAIRTPVPRIHDEFSYLLAADTFASGRLTNPTHPLWVHFETFHVIHQPTYASKYPPLQGLTLALGTFAAGHPIAGAWLATALAVAACCWMFQGWLPGRWAALGGLLVALHHSVQFYWGQTYWGGAAPMFGGALLFGAWVRLRRRPRPRDALLLALGVAVLANSRPFEGAVACLPVGLSLLRAWLGRSRPPTAVVLRRGVAPAAIALAVAAAAMALYNQRVTGDPWTLPYQVHEATYSDTPLFVWQPTRTTPVYRHAAIRDFYQGWVHAWYQQQQSLWRSLLLRGELLTFFFTPFLAASLAAFPWIFRSPRMRFAGGTAALVFAATLALPWEPRSHYLAPVAPLLFVICLQGLRVIWRCRWRDRRIGRLIVRALVAGHVILFGAALARYPQVEPPAWSVDRAQMLERLEGEPGHHLVLVQYAASHSVHEEWVFNAADIDAAKVVWARTTDAAATRRLREHFEGRRVWALYADRRPAPLLELQSEFDAKGSRR